MKKSVVTSMSILALALAGLAMFNSSIAGETNEDAKSVAWFVANIQEARQQNRVCYNTPDLQSTPNCVNALHALEISFKGGN
ncbi:EexN family lipoprotein [Methylomonas sp. LL1]|uniref:EexN family lipoprotein n=1 Tax=Methylomonas sp. LL1 TaxID=2785785 RepID=UPI0018C39EE5|nr:EexN family lipoprotein [Methylomonas sp. LL1]QPK64088.1 EexN family lipoprotein [Methylomonas sp. LL1]